MSTSQTSVLTKADVLARSGAPSLSAVRHLHCWGEDFGDISVLASMPNIEVLSLRYVLPPVFAGFPMPAPSGAVYALLSVCLPVSLAAVICSLSLSLDVPNLMKP